MEKTWEESHGEVTPRTFQELMKVSRRIDASEARQRRFRVVLSALAAAASVAVVALSTFFLTRSRYQVDPLGNTRSLVAANGKTASLVLEDGTRVSLNSGSSLLYPDSFGGDSRIVYLSGEGNFSVAKDASRPFIVRTAYLDVEALGTSFCVQAYTGDRFIRTTLKEGKVKVTPLEAVEAHILEPGMQLVYMPANRAVSLERVDAEKVMSWENGYLSFNHAAFSEIISALERRYDVSISYSSEKMRQRALNVRFMPDETLKDALDVLTLLIPGSGYKVDGKRVYFHF